MLALDPGDTLALASIALPVRAAGQEARSAGDVRPSARVAPGRRRGALQPRLPAAGVERSRRRRWRHSSARSRSIPTTTGAHYGLALSLIATRRLEEALAPLEKNTTLQPMSPYGWYQLARVQHDLGRTARNAEDARPPGPVRAQGRAAAANAKPDCAQARCHETTRQDVRWRADGRAHPGAKRAMPAAGLLRVEKVAILRKVRRPRPGAGKEQGLHAVRAQGIRRSRIET